MGAAEPILGRLEGQGLTLLVESRGRLAFASDRPGLRPLQDAVFSHGGLLDGADAALPRIGLAAAYLLIHAKVGRVFAGELTYEARSVLNEEGIEHSVSEYVRKLDPNDPIAKLDPVARQAVTLLAFVEELRRQAV